MVKFSLLWMMMALKIPQMRINVLLHLYSDMDIDEMIAYWSNILHIPKNQFSKPYIKTSKKIDIDYKGYGYGTCMLRVNDTTLKEKVLMAIKAIADESNLRIPEL